MFTVPPDSHKQYQDLGYLALPGVVPPAHLDSLIAILDTFSKPRSFKTISSGDFLYVKNVQRIGVRLLNTFTEIGVLALARSLLNGEPRLERDEYVVKRKNTSDSLPWHQDSAYWTHDPLVTILIQTADSRTGDGVLQASAGSHLTGKLTHVQTKQGLAVEKAPDEATATILGGPQGTILAIHPHLVHRGYSGDATIPTYTLVYSKA